MAVRVIKPGKLPEPVTFGGTCSHCGAVIECDQTDLEGPNSKFGSNILNCPTCYTLVTVNPLTHKQQTLNLLKQGYPLRFPTKNRPFSKESAQIFGRYLAQQARKHRFFKRNYINGY